MELKDNLSGDVKSFTCLKIKLLSARLGCSIEKSDELSALLFRIEFVRKNLIKGIEERLWSNKIPLKESLISDIDYDNDILEVSYCLINETIKKSRISKFSIVRLKDLIRNEEKDDVWILSRQSLLNVRYLVYSEKIENNNFNLNLIQMTNTDTNSKFTSSKDLNEDNLTEDSKIIHKPYVDSSLSRHYRVNSSSVQLTMNQSKVSSPVKPLKEGKAPRVKSISLINYEITMNKIKKNSSTNTNEILDAMDSYQSIVKEKSNMLAITNNKDNPTPSLLIKSPKKERMIPLYPIKNNETPLSGITSMSNKYKTNLNSQKVEKDPNKLDLSYNSKQPEKSISENSMNYKFCTSLNSNMKYFSSANTKMSITLNGNNLSGIEVIDYEIIEKSNLNNAELDYNTFCEAFFVSGLPKKNPKLISNSEEYRAPCNHKECSLLNSYRPEILYKFLKQDSSQHMFELSNVTASLCFPSGIKICYATDEKMIKPIKNFVNIITNQKGEKFYMINYHYYNKIDYVYFQNQYNYDPIKIFIKNYFESKSNAEVKGDKKLQTCLKWANNDFIYIPECITLISKFPFRLQLESCLDTIFSILSKLENSSKNTNLNLVEELQKLIHHCIDEIPAPPLNKKLIFYVPFHYGPLELPGFQSGCLPSINYNLKNILDTFSNENIILIFHLILLEQKILFIDDDYSKLSEISQSFISLIYPFAWENNLVPVLSEEFIKYLLSIVPFIMGIDEVLLKTAYKMKYILPEDEDNVIFLVNIKKNTIDRSTNKKSKKLSKKNLLEGLPDFPEEIYDELNSELKLIKKIIEDPKTKTNLSPDKIDSTIREVFVKIMVMLIGDYSSYLSEVSGDLPAFNNNLFINSRPKAYQSFYKELIQSQIFIQFLMNEKKGIGSYFFKMCIKYHNMINFSKKSSSKNKGNRSSSVSKQNLTQEENQLKTDPNRSFHITENQKFSTCNMMSYNSHVDKGRVWGTCQSFSLANENTVSNTKEIADYIMITPYFINDPITKFDLNKIEEFINEKYKIDFSINHESRIIFNNNNNIFESLDEKREDYVRRYFLNSTATMSQTSCYVSKSDAKNLKEKSKLYNEVKLDLVKGNSEEIVSNCGLLSYCSERNKTMISDCMSKILTSEPLNPKEFEMINKILFDKEGRSILSSILSAESYDDLQKLIFTALSYCKEEHSEFDLIRSIIKSTFFYYKMHKNRKIFVAHDINIKQYSFIKNKNFWMRWSELDTEQEQNTFNSSDDFSFNNMLVLASYMSKLKMDLNSIKDMIIDHIALKYFNTKSVGGLKMLKDLHNCIEKEYKLFINYKNNL